MITHVVLFRTKCDEHKKIVLEMAKKLADIEVAQNFACGAPLLSDRPVVDDTFAAAIVVTVKDENDLAVYANHPIHLNFMENCLAKYKVKVQVFDIVG